MTNTKDLLNQLVKTSFKLRYNNSILGIIWVILKPFLMFLIMYFVWSNLFGNKESYFAPKLMLGIVLWTFFNEGIIFGMNGLLDKAGIILKINFNRQIAVLASTLMAVINLSINFVLFIIIFAISNALNKLPFLAVNDLGNYFVGILIFLVAVFALYLVILGTSYFLSIIVVRFRDLQHIMELFFAIFYWITPVLVSYTQANAMSSTGNVYKTVLFNNPIGWPIEFGRSLIILNTPIANSQVTVAQVFLLLGIGIALIILGNLYFKNKVKAIAEYF